MNAVCAGASSTLFVFPTKLRKKGLYGSKLECKNHNPRRKMPNVSKNRELEQFNSLQTKNFGTEKK